MDNRHGIMLIDRGSKDVDVKHELYELCRLVKDKGNYYYATYSFLEVTEPSIEHGIKECKDSGVEFLTIVPYFLYPGLKMKLAVCKSARVAREMGLRFVIASSLNHHDMLIQLVRLRVSEAKSAYNIIEEDDKCDLLLIGHGSSDTNARKTFESIAHALRSYYKSVNICFLELDRPNIKEGIMLSSKGSSTLIIMPYFLHNGTHMKHDVKNEVNDALSYANVRCKVVIAGHLGVSSILADLIIARAREVESIIARASSKHKG
jgi:sirohydrochlorin ferrochelatase